MTSTLPKISVLVLNLNGRTHLDACLSSVEAQVYPRERVDIEVVDNGSTDDSLAFIRERYPRVRIHALDRNLGFCAPYNAAIQRSDSDFVALLNNDARVDPQWLAEMVAAADRHRAAAVASKILDWSGEKIDFVGGATTFIGHAWQRDFGGPASRQYDEGRLLFACGCSMLLSRAAFLDVGAFDEDFFAYFEDVDLGWRLNLFGYDVVLAPKAVTYHRQHGTSSRWALTLRLRLLERNALALIYKNYDSRTLQRVFPAAVALSLLRGLLASGIDELNLSFSEPPPASVDIEPRLIAHLIALEDFCRQLPDLRRKRAVVQERRCRSDDELFALFGGDPLRLHETFEPYEKVARALIRDCGIDEIFAAAPSAPSHSAAPATSPGEPREHQRQQLPRVSIVILTAVGPTHLRECLTSLRAQNYPEDRIEVIVVDNGSVDDPTSEVHAHFPRARVLRNATNLGFAAGNNLGAGVATGDYLIFLNDDTRAHPDWLRELVGTVLRRGAAAVASCLLDWSGQEVDFVDSAVNAEGKGFQLHYGTAIDQLSLAEKPLLFGCGAALLIDRAVFRDGGEWDEQTFAYYEDVELGWRLNLLGHEVWFSPRAVVYHKHHGTSARWPEPPRIRLYERNSLRNLYALLDTDGLAQTIPAALMLAADRALLSTGMSRASESTSQSPRQRLIRSLKAALRARRISKKTPLSQAIRRVGIRGIYGVPRDVVRLWFAKQSRSRREAYLVEQGGVPVTFDSWREPIPIEAAAILAGVYGFFSDLPNLTLRRAELQRRRKASDQRVLGQFATHWLSPSPAHYQAEHNAFQQVLVEEFGLAAIPEGRNHQAAAP